MEKLKVLIVNGDGAEQVRDMFVNQGWDIVTDIDDADLVQFVGGADVDPAMYGQHAHPSTHSSPARDQREKAIYIMALDRGIPMAGICRGGQFLNVMNGGEMYQDVDNHGISGTHDAYLNGAILPIKVTSTHHQMMSPNYEADVEILLTAREATQKIKMSSASFSKYQTLQRLNNNGTSPSDIEAVLYYDSRCLCFQPHPEYRGGHVKETLEAYFMFIEDYFFSAKADDKAKEPAAS